MRVLLIFCFLWGAETLAQNGVFNSAYKGNLNIQLGNSSNYFGLSTLNFTGSKYDLTLSNTRLEQPYEGMPGVTLGDFSSNQYKLSIGYTVKRGVLISLNLDNIKYHVSPQTLVISGRVMDGFDQLGGLSGTYNNTSVAMDTIGFRFGASSTKYIATKLEFIQNLYRLRSRMFVVNGVYGLGIGVLHTTSALVFGPSEQPVLSGLSGIGLNASLGLRVEFLRHFYVMPTLNGGFLFQRNIRLDVSDATQFAQHTASYGQLAINVGTVFFLGKQKNCDCPHF
jgi:hypothetical protein